MINHYETLFILRPDIKDEDVKILCKTIGETISANGGTVVKEDLWGKRELSYYVKKKKEGIYYKVDFNAPSASLIKIDLLFRLNGDILRTFVTNRGPAA